MLENISCVWYFLWQRKAISKSVMAVLYNSHRGGCNVSC